MSIFRPKIYDNNYNSNSKALNETRRVNLCESNSWLYGKITRGFSMR